MQMRNLINKIAIVLVIGVSGMFTTALGQGVGVVVFNRVPIFVRRPVFGFDGGFRGGFRTAPGFHSFGGPRTFRGFGRVWFAHHR